MNSSTSTSEAVFSRGAARRARLIGLVLGVMLTFLALQVVLSILPVEFGVHNATPAPGALSTRREPGLYRTSLAWDLRHVVHGRVNKAGFFSPYEFLPDEPAVGLFGDSFVEGQAVTFEESLAGQLQARLAMHPASPAGDAPKAAYNFGIAGASLAHYLGLAGEMSARHALKAAVLVIIPGDYEEGFQPLKGQYGWTAAPQDGAVIYPQPPVARSSFAKPLIGWALVRWFRGNLKVDLLPLSPHPSVATCIPSRLDDMDLQRLKRYIQTLPNSLRLPPERIVLVFNRTPYLTTVYAPIDRPVATAPSCPSRDSLALDRLQALAADAGMAVVDTTPILQADYGRYRHMLDFSPIDNHWNARAIHLVADAIHKVLSKDGWDEPRAN